MQPGTHLTVQSSSEALHLTLAYAAVSSVVAAIQEWRDLRGAQVGRCVNTADSCNNNDVCSGMGSLDNQSRSSCICAPHL